MALIKIPTSLRYLLIVMIILILLTGCPVTYYGLVKNESSDDVSIDGKKIGSGATLKIHWTENVKVLMNGENRKYYYGWPIPDGVVSQGLFSSTVNVIYKNGKLYYLTSDETELEVDLAP